MIIISDIDGTIADAITAWRMAVWEAYHVIIEYRDVNEFDASKAVYDKVCRESPHPPSSFREFDDYLYRRCFWNPTFYRNLMPIMGLWKPMSMIKQPIIYLTTRHPKMQTETDSWLARHGFFNNAESVAVLMRDKHVFIQETCESAAEDGEEVVFVDDKLKTMIEVSKLPCKNLKCYVPLRPWNDPETSYVNEEEWGRIDTNISVELKEDWLIGNVLLAKQAAREALSVCLKQS